MKRTLIAGLLSLATYSAVLQAENSPAVPQQAIQSLAPMLEKIMPAVVNISVQGQLPPGKVNPLSRSKDKNSKESRKFSSIGSGVIVDPVKGYVITNDHVVRHAKIITVTLNDGRRLSAKMIGGDSETDIAILHLNAKNLQTLPMGDSDNLKVGDFVVAIGNPFGLNNSGTSQTATFGIISALQRADLQIEGVENFIQTDAAINPGNSGGALVNTQGALIGINTAIISPYGIGNIGIGFAIPINMARTVMDQIIQFGSIHRGLMGIFVQPLTPELADAFNVPNSHGAVITQVNEGSPAQKAGLKAGDIITQINGETISTAAHVRNTIGLLRVGSTVKMEVLRNGKPLQISAEVTDVKQHEEQLQARNPFLFGLELRDFAQDSPVHGFIKGVQIVGAQETSPAWRAGLRPGDVIIGINQQPVTNYAELKAITDTKPKQLLMHILRSSGSLYLVIK